MRRARTVFGANGEITTEDDACMGNKLIWLCMR